MIKRYVLHIEAHKRHLPRVSFKRAPRAGDRVVDGGVPGTLKLCPVCEEGLLHEPDRRKTRSNVTPPGPHKWLGGYCVDCENNALFCPYPPSPPKTSILRLFLKGFAESLSRPSSYPTRPARPYYAPRPATHVELRATDPTPEPPVRGLKLEKPAKHVELTVKDEKTTEHVELKAKDEKTAEHVELTFEEESPETLELERKPGMRKYKVGDTVETHNAEYVVERFDNKVLYLVRKDVWEARKKAKHVELEVEEEKTTEHVELNFEERKPVEHVELKFD